MGSDESQDLRGGGGHVSTSFIRLAGPPRRRRAVDHRASSNGAAITHFLIPSYKLFLSTVNNGPAEKPMGGNFGVRDGGEERGQRVLMYVS